MLRRCPVHRSKIEYGDAPAQFGHLYHASDVADLPDTMRPIVLVHGGYWTTEFGLTIQSAIARQYAERGALVWNIEYRRVGEPGGGWPTSGNDVVAAIRALDDPVRGSLSAEVAPRVDWSSVAVVGHSAGGQLAIWSAAQLGARTARSRIDLVIAQAAALDLVGAGQADRPSVRALMGAFYRDAPERYRAASPMAAPVFDARVVAIHGERDAAIPVEVSREYVRQVSARGQRAEVIVVPEEGHDVFVDPRSVGNRQTMRVLGV
ncbi:alpha/beta hydrolase fold domain-containing protein [Gordonia sp. ABSL1-1]|uniref:alpha/beta hydrolase family protein n=1 Tax=Gordonia sp. ABSL1-1 TaxID=3053923 RepID=UPI002572E826|nr:alpha/beta fold hydrolase [Gordonia sp. ABSL1-1]MDL9935509.1 alpha/beta hydrolase fold domain-containing protein [Gordonia sp. ABSL1-1]